MELRQYILLLWKWAWLVAIAVIIAASASFYASKSATPLYSTKTTLMVGRGTDDPNPEYYELNTSRFLANTYIELVKREPVLQGAIDSLGLDMNWRGLAGRVSAKKIPDTQLMEISVIDNDPYRAKVLADAIANQLIIQSPADPSDIDQEQVLFSQNQITDLQTRIESAQTELDQINNELSAASSARQIDNLQNKKALLESKISDWQDTYAQLLLVIQGGDINTLRVVEEAPVPTQPFSPKVLQNVLTASAIAVVLAIAGAVLIEYLDDSIKTPEDVKQIVDLPTLGGITRIEGNNYDEKLVADPLFFAPGTGGIGRDTLGGYKLRLDSPCINIGILIAGNIDRDFYGNPINDGATDFGVYEQIGSGAFAGPQTQEELSRAE